MTESERFKKIHDEIFAKSYKDTLYVFLCGGATDDCIRDNIRVHLESNGIQVLYPEDLFMEMMNKDRKTNLLDYENILAKSANSILLICESMGSAAELGAFVQSEQIRNKLIIGIEKKYRRQHSFIMDGPVKKLQTIDKDRILIFDKTNLSQFKNSVIIQYRGLNSKRKKSFFKNTCPDFTMLPEYISFIPLILYFYKKYNRKQLYKNLKELIRNKYGIPKDYNELFNASLRYLHKLGIIYVNGNINIDRNITDQVLSLSEKGYISTDSFFRKSNIPYKNELHDRIRCDILKEQLNN